MKRIKLFKGDYIDEVQAEIDEWIDSKTMDIISVSTTVDDNRDVYVTVLYDDYDDEENDAGIQL